MKSDVKDYYSSIDHHILYDLLCRYIPDNYVLRLLWQYMRRTVYYGGIFREIKRGISLGCPLSPLMDALYLKPIDDKMKDSDLYYACYMDDWVIIAPTRWKLRNAVKIVNRILNKLRIIEKHPDKTYIGRVRNGFDFLGYHFNIHSLTMSIQTIINFLTKAIRLYEKEPPQTKLKRLGCMLDEWLITSTQIYESTATN